MSTLAPLIDAWDEAHREFAIALEGLPDEDVWVRPHPKLLSVGELAGHVALAHIIWALGDGQLKPDPTHIDFDTPFLDANLRYYPANLEEPVTLNLSAEEVREEVQRVYDSAKAAIQSRQKDDSHPYWETWGNLVQYQVFHVAYHTGQVYSVRHLLGHETEDN